MKYQLAKGLGMALSGVMLIIGSVMAEEPEKGQTPPWRLEPITVYGSPTGTGEADRKGFVLPTDVLAPTNQQSFTQKGIEAFAKPGNINVFKVIEMSPSVNFTPVDNLGTNENGFHDSIRIRGKKQTGPGGLKTYEGVPISGNPGGGKTIFDLENIERVDLYKGYIPIDRGLGFSNLAGKVDLNIKRPEHSLGADVSQTVGSDDFSRTFLRIDTGDIGNVSSFGSFSYTASDKYKGEGDLNRTNGSSGIVYEPNDKFKTELFVSNNHDDHNNYYNLTYAETQDLGKYFDKDFNTNKASPNYYGYNKQDFEDTAIVANIEGTLFSDSKIRASKNGL
ncbi:TonB-dependent receptor plug domain-containing protein [Desulforhabdus sp. TSK]|uniref:TonB-dependent receptor plug domain-containing protein n=1 Tax=Desulforhabdus sp. TSK TaxID=2925014 RepID=UPI001FC8D102|nr:TonB-dependent receptor plug domain-containing protein [Desulforhabdus sp. TSK]GKT11005.1 hypothetical protein DSTSK_43100 [Desulforhabdus sp. TSK]